MGLERYEIVRELGQGTCGKTFLAKDTGLPSNRLCVLKQLKPLINNPETYELIKARFMVEARVLERLGRETDRIPELFELISESRELYLVQEWIEGKTVREIIHAGPINPTEVTTILLGILEALRRLYSKGVIHRDINPNNIILRANNSDAVLIDFGFVKEVVTTIVDEHGTPEKHSIIVGTQGYIAPEQALGKPVFASDLFSLGMTAITMLTAKHPSEMTDSASATVQWEKYAPSVTSEFAAVIEKAIQPNYLHRYANANEMFEAVRSCIKESIDPKLIAVGSHRFAEDVWQPKEIIDLEPSTNSSENTLAQESPDPWTLRVNNHPPPVSKRGVIDLALELGKVTLIHRSGMGVVVSEPSIIALNDSTNAVEAIGRDALDLLLLTENNLKIIRPIQDEKIADRHLAATMLQYFFEKACGGSVSTRQRVSVAVPAKLTQVERRAMVDTLYRAGAHKVFLLQRAACAAVGADLPLKGSLGNMIVHVAETATEILSTSGGRRASFNVVNVGIAQLYDAIARYLKLKYNLLIGEQAAAHIFEILASAFPFEERETTTANGRNLIVGIPRSIEIDDEEVREAIADHVATIINGVRVAMEQTPADVSADICEHGIVLSGIGSRLRNLDTRLSIETGIPVSVVEHPLSCVVAGAASILKTANPQPEQKPVEYRLLYSTRLKSPSLLAQAVRSFFPRVFPYLAIDLGAANMLVYSRGRGIVVSEPAIMAINRKTHRVEAMGFYAKEILGRPSYEIMANRPITEGTIADISVASKLLRYAIRKAVGRPIALPKPTVVITVPSHLTKVDLEAFAISAYQGGASRVFLIEQAMAAAIGSGLPITEPFGNFIVNIGDGLTEIALISLIGVVYSKVVPVGGNDMNRAISQYVLRKYNLMIGERTAEAIKIELGSAFPLDDELSLEIRGRNIIEGIPKTITITDEDIREALADQVSTIVNAVRDALERVPPEFSADIVEYGIVITGGSALLKNLDKRLSIETGLSVALAEDPITSVILGAGKILSDLDMLKRAAKAYV